MDLTWRWQAYNQLLIMELEYKQVSLKPQGNEKTKEAEVCQQLGIVCLSHTHTKKGSGRFVATQLCSISKQVA